jgi:hypothetical protein
MKTTKFGIIPIMAFDFFFVAECNGGVATM